MTPPAVAPAVAVAAAPSRPTLRTPSMTKPAPVPSFSGAPVLVESEILGPFTVPRHELFHFGGGLLGFPECRTFALVPAGRDGLFWLQSVDHRALAFLLVDPFGPFPDYTVDLSAADLARLGTSDPSEVLVLAIVTLPADRGRSCTANLQGPVVMNVARRNGHQAVLGEGKAGTREPLSIA